MPRKSDLEITEVRSDYNRLSWYIQNQGMGGILYELTTIYLLSISLLALANVPLPIETVSYLMLWIGGAIIVIFLWAGRFITSGDGPQSNILTVGTRKEKEVSHSSHETHCEDTPCKEPADHHVRFYDVTYFLGYEIKRKYLGSVFRCDDHHFDHYWPTEAVHLEPELE